LQPHTCARTICSDEIAADVDTGKVSSLDVPRNGFRTRSARLAVLIDADNGGSVRIRVKAATGSQPEAKAPRAHREAAAKA
jgi:hypothetical protein